MRVEQAAEAVGLLCPHRGDDGHDRALVHIPKTPHVPGMLVRLSVRSPHSRGTSARAERVADSGEWRATFGCIGGVFARLWGRLILYVKSPVLADPSG